MRYFGDVGPLNNWWIRPFAHLPKRFILDANVLLDLILMSDSVSRASVKVLNSQGYKFFTSSQAVEEAKSTLRKYKPHQDLSSLIDDVVKGLGVEIISSPISVPQIKPHDRHIAAAVADVDGVLVSEDIALIGQMNSAQMHARTLREIAIGLVHPDEPRQDLWSFGSGLGADGHFFIKCAADLALTANRHRRWYLLDVEHFGTLAFNSQNRTFEFASELDGKVIAVDFEPMPGRQLALLLEYDVGKHDTSIRLKVKHFGGSDENRAQGLLSPLERAPGPGVTGMNRRQHDLGWCGAVQNISYGPHKLNSNSWKICSSLIGVAPSTLTADLSFLAALLVDIHPSKKLVQRPTLEQVRKFADVSVAFLYPGRRRRERGDPYLPNPAVEWLEKEFGLTKAKRVAKDAAR